MQENLYYDYQKGQECINEAYDTCPSVSSYYEYVASVLRCEVSELAMLLINPSFDECDKDGSNVESFFPLFSDVKIKVLGITPDLGETMEITYNGERFIADRYNKNTPLAIWAKYENV